MNIRRFLVAAIAGVGVMGAAGAAVAQPKPSACTADFALSKEMGARASADLKDGGLDRFFLEMGPTRAALTTKGPGVSGAYKAQSPDLKFWFYMSIYQPAKEWLTPGSVRLDYSGFRIGWPEFRVGGKPVKALKLTIKQGERSMTVNVAGGAEGAAINNRVFAIDFEAMLPGPYPAQRVDDHAAWRAVEGQSRPLSVTFADASNGKIIATAEAVRLPLDVQGQLVSGGVNALREKFKAGKCS